MNSSLRLTLFIIGAVGIVAVIIAVALSNSDSDDSPVTNPTTVTNPTSGAQPTPDAQPTPTARPTVTPVIQPSITPAPSSTSVPALTATPTPLPTATPTPPPPDSHIQEMTRLFSEHGIEFSKQFVESVGAARWPSTSLGCPEPGVFYDLADAPYTGFIYVLSDGTNSWEYHTNEDDSMIVRCSEIEPATRSTVNVGKEAGLDRSTGVSLMRRDFDTDQFNEVKPMTAGDHDRLVAIFDLDTQLSDPNGCVTVFRLDFSTPSGVQEIEFMCADDKNGFHVFWQEMQGTAPVIGRIIGPYLTGGPIPTLPEQ